MTHLAPAHVSDCFYARCQRGSTGYEHFPKPATEKNSLKCLWPLGRKAADAYMYITARTRPFQTCKIPPSRTFFSSVCLVGCGFIAGAEV